MKTKMLVLLSHGTFMSAHNIAAESWDEAKHHVFQWGVYCERLRVTPDKPRIRLYALFDVAYDLNDESTHPRH